MSGIKNYIDENLNEAFIGNVELNKLANKASELAQKVPTGVGLNNRLAKAGEKELSTKLIQAQKLKEELRDTRTKIAPLKDSDTAGRKAVKGTLQRIIKNLEKLQGLEAQAEKALAAKASASRVEYSRGKWAGKKRDFKERVKENLDRKRTERKEKVKSMVGKAKARMRHSMASFEN